MGSPNLWRRLVLIVFLVETVAGIVALRKQAVPASASLRQQPAVAVGQSLTPAGISALRAKYATVDAVVRPGHVDVLLHGTKADTIFSAMQPPGELGAELRARRYDAAVVTWATARTAMLALRSGARERVGQARRLYSNLFTKRVVVRSELGDTTAKVHRVHLAVRLGTRFRTRESVTLAPWRDEGLTADRHRALKVDRRVIVPALAGAENTVVADNRKRVVVRCNDTACQPHNDP